MPMSPHYRPPERDETFISDAQMERRFPGLAAHLRAVKQYPSILAWLDAWPATIPSDFDHVLLKELRLPCGPSDDVAGYALVYEGGGWRIRRVVDLADELEAAVAAMKKKKEVK